MQDFGREMTRGEYDAFVGRLPKEAQGQWWPVPWRIATASERMVKILLWGSESIAVVVGLIVLAYISSIMIEGAAKSFETKDRCLKAATNGLEIQKCDR